MQWLLLLLAFLGVFSQEWRCISFYGLETPKKDFVCSWEAPPSFYLSQLKMNMGINSVRVPFSYELLTGKDLHLLDSIVDAATALDMNILLDWHRTWASHQGPRPEEGITMQDFINAWIQILDRYESNKKVLGVGIFNEIQDIDSTYTIDMHRKVVPAIEYRFPNRFQYFLGCPGWGRNCQDMARLMDMPTWNRTFIEVHKYRLSGKSDELDWNQSMPFQIPADHWFIGETGWKQDQPNDLMWARGWLDYLVRRNISNVCLWTIAHSGDTDGWYRDDCKTFDKEKAAEVVSTVWKNSTENLLSALLHINRLRGNDFSFHGK
jgi:hypothetical protein